MKIKLDVEGVSVLVRKDRVDVIFINFREKAFPLIKEKAHAIINVQKGTGVEWCRKVLKIEPEMISAEETKLFDAIVKYFKKGEGK